MSFTVFCTETCPKCYEPITHANIELHPTSSDLAVHNFTCAACAGKI